MHINQKKVLAREFIFFVVGILAVAFFYIGILLYNHFKIKKFRQNEDFKWSLTLLRDSLAKPYDEKLAKELWFYERCKSNNLISKGNRLTLWIRMNQLIANDSLEFKYNSIERNLIFKNMGFETVGDLKNFINLNTIHVSEVNDKKKANEINDKLTLLRDEDNSLLNSTLNESEQTQTIGLVVLITFSSLFILRWFYYGCKWSLAILRQ